MCRIQMERVNSHIINCAGDAGMGVPSARCARSPARPAAPTTSLTNHSAASQDEYKHHLNIMAGTSTTAYRIAHRRKRAAVVSDELDGSIEIATGWIQHFNRVIHSKRSAGKICKRTKWQSSRNVRVAMPTGRFVCRHARNHLLGERKSARRGKVT